MIKLSFTLSGIPRYVRATYFMICADRTLRGPEGSLVASYTSHGWILRGQRYREFEALGPLILRVHSADGGRQHLGPFEVLRAGGGALFSGSRCLGLFCTNRAASPDLPEWTDIAFLEVGERVPAFADAEESRRDRYTKRE